MENKYIVENQEAVNKIILAMTPAFKNNNLVNKPAPISHSEVVVVKKREKLHRFGVNVTSDGEQYILKNVLVLSEYLIQKYKLDKFAAEKIATDIMSFHILKIVYENCGFEFISNYARFINKREKYALYKGLILIALIVFIVLFFLLK